MLELREVRVAHGAATAIWDLSLAVGAGELVRVVGPNGAGSYRKAARAASLERVLGIFLALKAKLAAPAGTLSGGQQQMVAIGRALMCQPRLLLLDEPSLGLAPAIVLEMFDVIAEINRAGMAVLLVEQNVAMALQVATRAYVLEEGRIAAQGRPAELLASPHIRRAYLGEARAAGAAGC